MAKRILIVSQYFAPENFKINDIAFEFKKKGYTVDVLTSIPNYPEGKYYEGYGIFKRRVEHINNVNIYRAFQFSRGKHATSLRLALNYFSFAFFASIWALFLCVFKKKYDLIFVFQVSPILQAIPAIIYKKICKTPIITWVLDIWPESMFSDKRHPNKYIVSIILKIVNCVYRNSDKILISSKPMRENITSKGYYDDKIEYFPNWCDEIKKTEISLPYKFESEYVFMMAGNLGTGQIIPELLDAMKQLKGYKQILWVFVGDGSMKDELDKFVVQNGMKENVMTTGRYPFEYMHYFYDKADVMLLTLQKKSLQHIVVVPGRFQSYMAMGKPVIVLADKGASSDLINEAQCGYACTTANDFVKIIKENILGHKDNLKELGINGKKYFSKFFTKEICMNKLEDIFNQII